MISSLDNYIQKSKQQKTELIMNLRISQLVKVYICDHETKVQIYLTRHVVDLNKAGLIEGFHVFTFSCEEYTFSLASIKVIE